MNSLWQFICSISIALAVTACAQDYDDHRPAVNGQQPEEAREYTINGMKVEQFYAQLFVKIAGSCESNTVTYQYPASDIVQIGFGSGIGGKPVMANLSLIMAENHTYRAIYREWARIGTNGFYVVTQEKVLSGNWKTEATDLILDGLGKAEGLSFNGKPALRVRFSKDIISPGILNRTLLLETTTNHWAPFPEYNPCDL